MRARIYDKNTNSYYISEVYGILNCGGYDVYIVDKAHEPETVVLVEYLDLSARNEYNTYNVNVEKIDINPSAQYKWVYMRDSDIDGINSAFDSPGKYHYFHGYDFIWQRSETLCELIAKGKISKEKLGVDKISTKPAGWNYIESQTDIDDLMRKFDGFHDSVLKELSYVTGDYVSGDSMFLTEAGQKSVRLVFDSDRADEIEIVLLAPRWIQVVPPAENYLADLFDASVFIKDCMVYFYDSYLENIPEKYDSTYFSAMGMMWRFIKK